MKLSQRTPVLPTFLTIWLHISLWGFFTSRKIYFKIGSRGISLLRAVLGCQFGLEYIMSNYILQKFQEISVQAVCVGCTWGRWILPGHNISSLYSINCLANEHTMYTPGHTLNRAVHTPEAQLTAHSALHSIMLLPSFQWFQEATASFIINVYLASLLLPTTS